MHRAQLLILVLALIMLPAESTAQAVLPTLNGQALEGVRSFDTHVRIATWLVEDEDRDRLRDNATSTFELALRRDGVVVDREAPNYLICEIWAAQSGGTMVYTYIVNYYTYALSGVHRLEWRGGGIVTVGRRNFSTREVGQDCADTFANEWLRWNPPG